MFQNEIELSPQLPPTLTVRHGKVNILFTKITHGRMKIIQFNVKFKNVIAFEQTSWENTKNKPLSKSKLRPFPLTLGRLLEKFKSQVP